VIPGGGLAPLKSLFPEIIQTIPVSKNSGETLTFSSNFVGESSIVFPTLTDKCPKFPDIPKLWGMSIGRKWAFFSSAKISLFGMGDNGNKTFWLVKVVPVWLGAVADALGSGAC
jgi:hypothetical protein